MGASTVGLPRATESGVENHRKRFALEAGPDNKVLNDTFRAVAPQHASANSHTKPGSLNPPAAELRYVPDAGLAGARPARLKPATWVVIREPTSQQRRCSGSQSRCNVATAVSASSGSIQSWKRTHRPSLIS